MNGTATQEVLEDMMDRDSQNLVDAVVAGKGDSGVCKQHAPLADLSVAHFKKSVVMDAKVDDVRSTLLAMNGNGNGKGKPESVHLKFGPFEMDAKGVQIANAIYKLFMIFGICAAIYMLLVLHGKADPIRLSPVPKTALITETK